MGTDPTISVICPVYNTEKVLGKCIHSIIEQDFKDIEIILVNDGSTDGSLKICQQYAQKDNRIIIIDKTNEGRNAARRDGTMKARGEYVFYIDCDDYLEYYALSTLLSIVRDKDLDMIAGSHDKVFDSWGILSRPDGHYKNSERLLSGRDFLEICLGLIPPSPGEGIFMWGNLYRRSCIYEAMNQGEQYLFPPSKEMLSEDLIFNLIIAKYIRSCWLTDKVIYHYRYGGETSGCYPGFTKAKYYFDYRHETCLEYGMEDKLKSAVLNYAYMAYIEAAQRIYFLKTPIDEVTESYMKVFSESKTVAWARQHCEEMTAYIKDPSKLPPSQLAMAVKAVVEGDSAAFANAILIQERFMRRHHYWKMRLLAPYMYMTNILYRLVNMCK